MSEQETTLAEDEEFAARRPRSLRTGRQRRQDGGDSDGTDSGGDSDGTDSGSDSDADGSDSDSDGSDS